MVFAEILITLGKFLLSRGSRDDLFRRDSRFRLDVYRAKYNEMKNHGFLTPFLFLICPGFPKRLFSLQWFILPSTNKELCKYKDAQLSESAMTAVAGAIIAQVAITALSLPLLDNAHWITTTLFIISLVSGCLSVYAACILHREMGLFTDGKHLRLWLTTFDKAKWVPPSPSAYQTGGKAQRRKSVHVRPRPYHVFERGVSPAGSFASSAGRTADTVDQNNRFASVTATLLLEAPRTLLDLSVGSFLCGFGVYLGLIWTKDLRAASDATQPTQSDQPTSSHDRNIFISFLVVTSLCYFGTYVIPDIFRNLDIGSFWLDGVKRFVAVLYRAQNPSRDSFQNPNYNISPTFLHDPFRIPSRNSSQNTLQLSEQAKTAKAQSFHNLNREEHDNCSGSQSLKSFPGHETQSSKQEAKEQANKMWERIPSARVREEWDTFVRNTPILNRAKRSSEMSFKFPYDEEELVNLPKPPRGLSNSRVSFRFHYEDAEPVSRSAPASRLSNSEILIDAIKALTRTQEESSEVIRRLVSQLERLHGLGSSKVAGQETPASNEQCF